MPSLCVRAASLVVVLTLSTAFAGTVPSFQALGDLPGGGVASFGLGLSADGSTAVGVSSSTASVSGTTEAFRWTAGDGMVALGVFPSAPPSPPYSTATSVSADGSVVVGGSSGQAFRWTAGSGLVSLGGSPGGVGTHFAYDTDASGDVVVGRAAWSASGGVAYSDAFRWTQATGIVRLGDLPGGDFYSRAEAVTPDGSVIVGTGNSIHGDEAFRWTSAGGMVGLGFLPGNNRSTAADVSADGNVIVGYGVSSTLGGRHAYRWTPADGMVPLGTLSDNDTWTVPHAVSADGNTIVGYGFSQSLVRKRAFIWTPDEGMRLLYDVLMDDFGLDLTDWELLEANDISADGRTIVGSGIDPAGQSMAWIVTIPEPASCLMALLAGAFVTRRRRTEL